MVDETDDAFIEARAVVGLHTGRNDGGVARVSLGKDLLLPGWAGANEGSPLFRAKAFFDCSESSWTKTKFHYDGNGAGDVGGRE